MSLLKNVVARAVRLCFSTRNTSRRAAYSTFFNRLLIRLSEFAKGRLGCAHQLATHNY